MNYGIVPRDLPPDMKVYEGATMKAITLKEPWATLIAIGEKTIETRSWNTNYRGPIAIHASRYDKEDRTAFEEPYRSILSRHGITNPQTELMYGCFVAVAELADCVLMEDMISGSRISERGRRYRYNGEDVSDIDLALGHWSPTRYAFVLRNVRRIPSPIPAKGSLGIWDARDFRLDAFIEP